MRFELDSPVRCTDGEFGRLTDVVVDPAAERVSHLVVEPRDRRRDARLVPVELVASAGGAGGAVELACTIEEADRLDSVHEFAYLEPGEAPPADPGWDVGVEDVLAPPSFDYEDLNGPILYDPHVALAYDRVPAGEVEIRRRSAVVSADGHRLGHVDGLVVDADEHITHVVLERGHLWGRRDVTIPISAVASVETDSVTLRLSKDEVGRLPAVPVRRRRRS